MSSASTVYVVDRLTARPGQARALLEAYRERYVPGAVARGMHLERTLVSPPLWLYDQSNTLEFVWTLDGAEGFWKVVPQARLDAAVRDWWASVDALIERRERYICADVEDLPPC